MPHSYTPSSVALTTVTLPDDGDPRTVASVNTAFQTLANAIVYVGGRTFTPVVHTLLVTGSFAIPVNALPFILAVGWGGGSGGGPGNGAPGTPSDVSRAGGGGGGGAVRTSEILAITPATTYAVTIGAGGAGGTQTSGIGFTPGTGSVGGNTIITGVHTFYGANRGGTHGQNAGGSGAPANLLSRGGSNRKFISLNTIDVTGNLALQGSIEIEETQGGYGVSTSVGTILIQRGGDNSDDNAFFTGGLPGTNGGIAGVITIEHAGGAGGGGAAGPGGNGATGGNGGNAVDAGAGSNGTNGADGAVNSGAGGGGGGGGGYSDSLSGSPHLYNAGNGGYGGSGYLRYTYFIPA